MIESYERVNTVKNDMEVKSTIGRNNKIAHLDFTVVKQIKTITILRLMCNILNV